METYVHRIGRTGRANREGVAYTLVTGREYMTLKPIERATKSKIRRRDIPTIDEIFESKYKNIFSRVKETIEQGDYKRFVPLATELDDEFNLVDVAAALMNIIYIKDVSYDYAENEIGSVGGGRYVRLFINVGKLDNLNPKRILEFFSDNVKINKEDVGNIDLLDKFSFVDVSDDVVDAIMKKCIGKNLCGRKVNIEVSNKTKR